jgi:hypothetical protein
MINFAALGRAAATNMHWQYVFKNTTPVPGTDGFCVDLNQSSGVPKYNPFAGSSITLTPLEGSGNLGVYTGVFETGKIKRLLRWQMTQLSTAPDHVYLLDYLAFYPLIDTDDPDIQVMDNTLNLPRYSNGKIVLIVQSPLVNSVPITITYTNQDGTSGQSSTFNLIPGAAIGVCATGTGTAGGQGQVTPFFPLAGNDTGVQRIESVQMGGGGGGFICAAIVHPVAELPIFEVRVPSEKQFGIFGQAPEIKQGACLNFVVSRSPATAGSFQGELLFVNV